MLLPILRHSAAHFCLPKQPSSPFPDIHLGVDQLSYGFHYDTDNTAGQISNEDLPRIEEEMQNVKENFPSIREEVTKDEAREIFKNDLLTSWNWSEEHSEDEGGLTIYRQWIRGPLAN